MKTLIVSCGMILGTLSAQSAPELESAAATNTAPMKQVAHRVAGIVCVKPGKVDELRSLLSEMPGGVAALYRAANIRNLGFHLKEIGGKTYLFTFREYHGRNFAEDTARMDGAEEMRSWKAKLAGLLEPAPPRAGWENMEEVFYTAGATDVVPTPEKYKRITMVTGLKPEKEAEYRALHASAWPAVLEGIRICNYRNFTIRLVELEGSLYLIGYLEYVGKDPNADDAFGKSIPANRRWWKYTGVCQTPLPAAASKGDIWEPLEEVKHLD